MDIKRGVTAGTTGKNDILISLFPEKEGIHINLRSKVEKQYGDQIRKTIENTLKELDITNVRVEADDLGAIDCTIRARVEAAVYKALE